jgi:hypothetical protein
MIKKDFKSFNSELRPQLLQSGAGQMAGNGEKGGANQWQDSGPEDSEDEGSCLKRLLKSSIQSGP